MPRSQGAGWRGSLIAIAAAASVAAAVTAADLRASGRKAAPLVVVGVGYNSMWERDRRNYDTWAARFDAEADRLVQTLRRLGALQVVWVTVREPKARFLTAAGRGELHLYSWYFPYVNERLRVLDRRRDDVVFADWAAVSNRPGLTYDSIQLTDKGGVLLARTIRRAIDAATRRQARARQRLRPRRRRRDVRRRGVATASVHPATLSISRG